MDGLSVVFIWETNNLSQGQGNQGLARRRTWHVAQARPQIDAEIVKKGHFRMKTSWQGRNYTGSSALLQHIVTGEIERRNLGVSTDRTKKILKFFKRGQFGDFQHLEITTRPGLEFAHLIGQP